MNRKIMIRNLLYAIGLNLTALAIIAMAVVPLYFSITGCDGEGSSSSGSSPQFNSPPGKSSASSGNPLNVNVNTLPGTTSETGGPGGGGTGGD